MTTAAKISQTHSEKRNDISGDYGPCDLCQLLKALDLTNVLKIHKNTLYELCQQNQIPFVKVGRQYRFLGWQINCAYGHRKIAICKGAIRH